MWFDTRTPLFEIQFYESIENFCHFILFLLINGNESVNHIDYHILIRT